MKTFAYADIIGSEDYPNLFGLATFYQSPLKGIWIRIEVSGLPDSDFLSQGDFYGMHIHEVGDCTLPFDKTGSHYNPSHMAHPNHAGDLPPLLGNHGYAYTIVFTDRLSPAEIINKSLIIHRNPDDFTTQPSGNSGVKIGCGVIHSCYSF